MCYPDISFVEFIKALFRCIRRKDSLCIYECGHKDIQLLIEYVPVKFKLHLNL